MAIVRILGPATIIAMGWLVMWGLSALIGLVFPLAAGQGALRVRAVWLSGARPMLLDEGGTSMVERAHTPERRLAPSSSHTRHSLVPLCKAGTSALFACLK
jgi:hypothetical protein